MLPITDTKDKRFFSMVVPYFQAGGDPTLKKIADFCKRYEINPQDFGAAMREDADGWVEKLKKLNMV